MPPERIVRIANGQGFWGDSIDAPLRLIEDGPLDYLTLDYLAEVTPMPKAGRTQWPCCA